MAMGLTNQALSWRFLLWAAYSANLLKNSELHWFVGTTTNSSCSTSLGNWSTLCTVGAVLNNFSTAWLKLQGNLGMA
jgi:hypothetical protein